MALYEMEGVLQYQKHPVTCSSCKLCICDFLIQKQLAVFSERHRKSKTQKIHTQNCPPCEDHKLRQLLPLNATTEEYCDLFKKDEQHGSCVTIAKTLQTTTKSLGLTLIPLLILDIVHRHYLYSKNLSRGTFTISLKCF